LSEFHALITEARTNGWLFVIINDNIDLLTLDGRGVIAGIRAAVRLQVALHGGQISSGMARAKERGLRIGAPPMTSAATVEIVVDFYLSGMSAAAICDHLNARCIDTPKAGGTWTIAKVKGLLRRQHTARIITMMRQSNAEGGNLGIR
jgi:DNA invertase Pin-like site-specific DNA recombinase